jgi:subtilisin-like proprotein convertase family protein
VAPTPARPAASDLLQKLAQSDVFQSISRAAQPLLNALGPTVRKDLAVIARDLGFEVHPSDGPASPPRNPAPSTVEATGTATPDQAFPAHGSATSTIHLDGTFDVSKLNLTLAANHKDLTGLEVTLTSPSGKQVTLPDPHAKSVNGSFDLSSAFAGEAVAGDWKIDVHSKWAKDTGHLVSWSLDATGATAPRPPDPGGPPALKQIGHVWVIMMENQDWSNIKGNPDAPFMNDFILKNGAHAENYVAETHPSEPNYIELEAGSTLGVNDDGDPRKNHQSTHDHLTAYLAQAGVSWKSYQEDISGKVVPLDATGEYAPKHNPNIFFDDNTGGGNPNDPFGIAHNRPYSEMAGDLKTGTEPQYSFITPNLINDGHDSGGPLHNRVAQQDAWLKQQIPLIMASKDYQKDGAIMIVWDEGKSGAHNPSGMVTLSPFAKPGYSNTTSYSHASTLRSLQEIFGVGPFLGDAANATDLSDLFQDPAPVTPPGADAVQG